MVLGNFSKVPGSMYAAPPYTSRGDRPIMGWRLKAQCSSNPGQPLTVVLIPMLDKFTLVTGKVSGVSIIAAVPKGVYLRHI